MTNYFAAFSRDAEIVDKAKPEPNRRRRLMFIVGGAVAAVILISIAIAVPVSMKNSASAGSSGSNMAVETIADERTDTAKETTVAPPPPPVDTRTPICRCDAGVFYNNNCYNLTDAVNAAAAGGVLYLSNQITVTNEVIVNKSISFVGTRECGNQLPTVKVTMPPRTDIGVFRVKGDGTSLTLKGVLFLKVGKTLGSVVRSIDLPDDELLGVDGSEYKPTRERINLSIQNCEFRDFETMWRGGSVIYIEKVGQVNILHSTFTNNIVSTKKILYDGTGAIYFRIVPPTSVVTIKNCTFSRNKQNFEHGLGGAFGVTFLDGKLIATGNRLVENQSRGGGAVYVEFVQPSGYVQLDGTFVGNRVVDVGSGSRGGAVWLKDILGNVDITGVFVNNSSPTDRGGVIANNQLKGGRVTIRADFRKNTAGKGASIWDTFYEFSGATLTFKRGNKASNNWSDLKADVAVRLVRPRVARQTIKIGNDTLVLVDNTNIESFNGFKVFNKTIETPTLVNGTTVMRPARFKAPALPWYLKDVETVESELNVAGTDLVLS